MSYSAKIKQAAQQIADRLQQRALRLETEIAKLEQEVTEKKAQRDMAHLAPERTRDFQPELGGHLQCPRCWIEDEVRSPMPPISGSADEDRFRCSKCHYELSFPA